MSTSPRSSSHLAALGENEILCTYNRGQGMYATDLTFWQARSHDGGQSWGDHQLITDHAKDKRPYSYHSPFLTRMSDGLLTIIAFRVDRSDPQRPIFNELSGGLTELEVILQRSHDDGRSWSAPEVVDVPAGMVITPSSGIVELADGSWFLAYDQWHAFDDPGPYKPRTVGFFSGDQGRTWGEAVSFADGSAAGKGILAWPYYDLERPTLVCPILECRHGTEHGPSATASLFRLEGWPAAGAHQRRPNIPGQTNGVVDLGGGQLAAIYTTREQNQPGFRALPIG